MDKKNNGSSSFFTVIVTVYNCEKYIIETLKSIECQTFTDYEVIIVEDCSVDRSYELVKNFIHGRSKWSLYRNEKNSGVGYSRNRAFSLAEGQFVAILDSDDVWMRDKLEKQYELMKHGDVDLCYTAYSFMDTESKDMNFNYRVKPEVTYKALLKENYIGCSTAVVSKKIAKSIRMNENMINEDFYFWLQVLKEGYVGKGITEPLVKYRIHEKARSYNKFKAAYNRFTMYRESEQLSFGWRWFYFFHYSTRALIKFVRLFWRSKLGVRSSLNSNESEVQSDRA